MKIFIFGVMSAVEKQEETKKKLDEAGQELAEKRNAVSEGLKKRKDTISGELEQRIEELKSRIRRLRRRRSQTSRRLLNAFPSFNSERYKEALDELKKRMKIK